MPAIPGVLEYLDISGVRACVSTDAHPASNRVSEAHLSAQNVRPTIRRLIDFYRSQKKGFGWTVGPNSTPLNLEELLIEAGMIRKFTTHGMYLPDMHRMIQSNPDLTIIERPLNDPGPAISIMAEGFETSEDSARRFHELTCKANPTIRSRMYIAENKSHRKAIACAYMAYYPDIPFALLGGAATLKEFRGNRAYTSLLARRVEDAGCDGMLSCIVQADTATSAPICARLGLLKACELRIYIWTPEN